MIINKNQMLNFNDIITTITNVVIVVIIISILLSILFKDHFNELKKLRDSENMIIMNHTKEILEDMYNVPIVIRTLKRNRYRVLVGSPKKVYGNYIYGIYISETYDKFIIYWELSEDIPEIKKIEKYASKEVIYEFEQYHRGDTKFEDKRQT